MKIKIKKLTPDAIIPQYAHSYGDAAVDLVATTKTEGFNPETREMSYWEYGTGLAFELPPNHVGLIFPRSSVSNTSMILSNCVGIIDENYRGEVKFRFKQVGHNPTYNIGDRVGQLIVIPIERMKFEEVEELSESNRGSGGYGSTGK